MTQRSISPFLSKKFRRNVEVRKITHQEALNNWWLISSAVKNEPIFPNFLFVRAETKSSNDKLSTNINFPTPNYSRELMSFVPSHPSSICRVKYWSACCALSGWFTPTQRPTLTIERQFGANKLQTTLPRWRQSEIQIEAITLSHILLFL